jgi:Leucine-rich repeat (LRR) protein
VSPLGSVAARARFGFVCVALDGCFGWFGPKSKSTGNANDKHTHPPQNSDVSENKLVSIPPAIGRCTTLTRLDLHSNNIVDLPPDLGRLAGLKHLSLHFNQLEALPAGAGG